MWYGVFRGRVSAALTVCLILAIGILGTGTAFAQISGATLTGTVQDISGAAIPNAEVSVTNMATGVNRKIVTDSAGFYTVSNLLPGDYEVAISAQGFTSQLRKGITLTVGSHQVLDPKMQVGQVSETIQVTAEAPTVELASSTLSAEIDATAVRELPLNGRSWSDLATLQPGVIPVQTQASFTDGGHRGNRGFGSQTTVAGSRPAQSNYRLDGITINDYTNAGPGSVLGGNLGVDAIQEFSILSSNFSAEYGKSAGGIINAITRSGTNQFHGAAYEFLRNSALDARNFFDGAKIPPFRRNQFGGDAGGPILKNKLFFFGDYEGVRQSKGITTKDTVPSDAARIGNLCSAPSPGSTCTPNSVTVAPSAQKYLPFWHAPNNGIKNGTNGDIGIFTFAAQQVVAEDFGTARGDYTISDKDSLALTYLGDSTNYNAPDTLDTVLISSKTFRTFATVEETHIFSPTLLNSARFGYSRDSVVNAAPLAAINPLAADPSLAAIPGRFAAQVSVSGITKFTGGVNGNSNNVVHWNSFQGYDDVVWTQGTHSLKFGVAVERTQMNKVALTNPTGQFNFGTLTDFLLGNPSRFQADSLPSASLPGPQITGMRQTLVGLYAQDDWRVRSNLTVNLGLRWEMITVPTEVKGQMSNLTNLTDATPHVGSSPISNFTLHNFDPRVGFAWDPFSNGKTSVRGGVGIYDILPLSGVFVILGSNYPFDLAGAISLPPNSGAFYSGAASLLGPTTNQATYFQQLHGRSYVTQWNLNVQRELLPKLTATVGYVGSHGVHEPVRSDDMNTVIPTQTPLGELFPKSGGVVVNPNFGIIRGLVYGGDSFYDALLVGVEKTMSHGVQLQASYTWGKSIDTGSATNFGDEFGNSIPISLYNLKSMRAPSDFNVGRELVISGLWHIPSERALPGPVQWFTNGWDVGGIYRASDGVPFTATLGSDGDPLGLQNSVPVDFPNRLNGPGCQSLINPGNPDNYIKSECFALPTAPAASSAQCNGFKNPAAPPPAGQVYCSNLQGNAGRNILTGPGTSNLDFFLFKNNYIPRISENFNLQLRAEVFNILNRANFAVPINPDNTDIYDSSGAPTGVAGLLTSTTTTAREMQLALKLIW
jgi:Carboxypeptidase regulatory-like domain/TonB-dependent Receptor Plug Domain